jgi:putative acetyltransferase
MIRIAKPEDLTTLAQIYRNSVQQLAPQLYSSEQVKAWSQAPDNWEYFQQFIFNPTTYLWEQEGEIIGFCGLENNGHIASLYVAPQHTRKGIGTKLLKNVLHEGRKLDIKRYYTEASYLSKMVFERCGFIVYDEEYVKYGDVKFHRYKLEKLNNYL